MFESHLRVKFDLWSLWNTPCTNKHQVAFESGGFVCDSAKVTCIWTSENVASFWGKFVIPGKSLTVAFNLHNLWNGKMFGRNSTYVGSCSF